MLHGGEVVPLANVVEGKQDVLLCIFNGAAVLVACASGDKLSLKEGIKHKVAAGAYELRCRHGNA